MRNTDDIHRIKFGGFVFMKNFISILLVLLITNVIGQTTRFNIQKDFYGNADAATSVVEIKGGYLVGGNTYNSSAQQQITFCKIDSIGNEIWRKEYLKNGSKPFITDCMPNLLDSTSIYIVNHQFPSGKIAGGIMKANMKGDTLWHKFIYDTTFESQSHTISKLSNGDLLISGSSNEFDFYVDVWLMRTDSLGNQIWIKHFADTGTYEFTTKVFQMHNGDFMISGSTYNFTTQIVKPKIIITDSLGNFKQQIIYGNAIFSNKPCIAVEVDTNVIWSFAFEGLVDAGTYFEGKVALNILDSNLISQSYIYLSPLSTFWNTVNDVLFKSSYIYFQGSTSNLSIGKTAIHVIKFDSVANVLTERYYKVFDDTDYGNHFINTYDGGFMIVGTTQPYILTQDWKIVKTDSLGCDTLGCEIYDNVQELPIKQKYTHIEVYPNPSTDIVFLKIDEETGFDFLGGTIELFDNMGKLVFEKSITHSFSHSAQINLTDLPQGIYIGRVSVKNNVIGNFKIVKQ